MAFSPEKCTVVHITHNKKPVVTNYQLHGHTLERELSSKYLGITISKDLKWNTRVNNIATRANRSLGLIRRNLRACKPPINTDRQSMMYKISHSLVDVDRRTRGTTRFREIAAARDGYKYSFYPWANRLPPDTTAAPSLEGFKAGLEDYQQAKLPLPTSN